MERNFELRRWSPSRHLFSGIVFVTIGVAFLLGNMGLMNVNYVFRFWPVILIAAGALKLVESRDDFAHSSGIFWIVVGGLFLMGSMGILRVAFRDFWPVVLIGLGALLLWRSAFIKRQPRTFDSRPAGPSSFTTEEPGAAGAEAGHAPPAPAASSPASSDSIVSAMAILGAVQRRNNSQDFRGGNVTAFMGGCEIDLRSAGISGENEPVLDVFAMWGGIEIRVPPEWTVVSHVDPILGGYEDNTRPPKEPSKRLIIRGTVIMGGIEVKN
jgi:predicted membrane protein